MKNFRHIAFTVAVLLFLSGTNISAQKSEQKMTAEEIVAKHLESVAAPENRKTLRNQVSSGTVKFVVFKQGGNGDGKIVLASESGKSLLGMSLSIPTYPGETFIFDGKKVKVGYTINNSRSPLGDYLYRYQDAIKEGLLGGTLSANWALNDLNSRKSKIELSGSKKINDRDAFVLSYSPKGGSDLQINVFIDKQNFQHLRTEYRRVITARQGTSPDASSSQREQRQVLIEDFTNYKKEFSGALNLPHTYRIYLLLEGNSATREYEWKAELTDFFFNQPLDPNSFNTEQK